MTHDESVGEDVAPALPILDHPSEGVPAVVDSHDALAEAVDALRAGTGPIAIDAERAGGYRYSQRAYLLQFRRAGSGTHLVDPIPLESLDTLADALRGEEWIIHAASQDLPCLRELGMVPDTIFDTELAGRLLGYPKVSLSALLERFCGVSLAKEHSAADWSTRPLPEPWLRYAALDVELLLELRDTLEHELHASGKWEWAREEFAAAASMEPAPAREEPWRRTSGLHKVRKPRSLAVVRSLWEARDEAARRRDSAPGRVLADSAIVSAATGMPGSPVELLTLPGWGGRAAKRNVDQWWRAIDRARTLPDDELPKQSRGTSGPPPPRAWPERDPAAAARLASVREALRVISERVDTPVENLLPPDAVRRLCWEPPAPVTADSVESALATGGARRWQLELTGAAVLNALLTAAVPSAPTGPSEPATSETPSGV